ncbi:MAG: hypothetical protein HS111_05835 [Kofleriaceae bacterium]|nr:hypothetical protein [Kofleriaceae bacterium]
MGRPLRDAPGVTLDVVDPDGELCGRGLYEGEGAIALPAVDARRPAHRRRAGGGAGQGGGRAPPPLPRSDALQHVRLVNGESDGLPGVAVERYADYLVVQLFSPSLTEAPALRAALLDALEAELAPRGI